MDNQKEIERMAKVIFESGVALEGADFALGVNSDDHFTRLAQRLINAGYRLCGGDNCPNYKHYQAECKRCTKKMEIKKALEIDAIKQQAVREFAERLKEIISLMTMERDAEYKDGYNDAIKEIIAEIDKLVKEVCGE